MANVNGIKNQVAKARPQDVTTLIQKSVKELGKALPMHMNAERLVRIALTTLRVNPELYKCSPQSFLAALFQSAQLGLEPNVEGQAYILPFNNKRKQPDGSWKTVKEAQFLIGYKGYVELFYRHQKSISLDMQVVRQNDDFEYALGTESYIKHKPALTNRGEAIGYYAVAKMKDGAGVFKFMSKEECMEHGKKHSKCYSKKEEKFFDYTPWNTNPDAMCLKTVLMQLTKLLPKSIEIQRAIAMDETVKTKVDKDMFQVPDKAEWNGEHVEDAEIKENGNNKKPNLYKQLLEKAELAKSEVGEKQYYKILGEEFGFEHANEIRDTKTLGKFIDRCREVYNQNKEE